MIFYTIVSGGWTCFGGYGLLPDMKKSGLGLVLGMLVGLGGGSSARADWEATMAMTIPEKAAMEGHIRMSKDKVRLDMSSPMPMSSIVHTDKGKAYTLMHPMKMIVETDIKQMNNQIPMCKATEIDACLTKQGFKKTGAAKVGKYDCDIYESKHEHKGKTLTVKLWRPKGLKEVPAVRVEATPQGEKTIVTELRDVEVKAQAASHFEVPKDYRNMGAMKIPGMEGV